MKQDVWITIVGTQRADGESDQVELATVGCLERENGWTRICYEETETTGYAGCTTTVTVYGNERVVMDREGSSRSQMIIEKGKRHQCQYETELGFLMLGIGGEYIENRLTDQGGTLRFGYTIDVNAGLASENDVRIEIKECHKEYDKPRAEC